MNMPPAKNPAHRFDLPPIIYNRRLSNYIDFALIKYGFQYLKREVSSIDSLEDKIELNVAKFKPANRTASVGRKNWAWSCANHRITRLYEILKTEPETSRHGVQPTHTLDELLKPERPISGQDFPVRGVRR
jgi:hypothetical protein